jgi:predicted nuclease of predicted toxin-antitoxin system
VRFLVDQCLSPLLAALLTDAGHDAVHIADRKMERAEDSEILALAESEDRVLLSADSDFGEILTVGEKRKPSLVFFRGEFEVAAHDQARLLLGCLPEVCADLEKGAIVVVTRTTIRVREL